MTLWRRLTERFWFVPAVLCGLAVVAALGLVAADRATREPVAPGWADLLLYRVGADGSRDLLGAIATSSLAVAGTTFSITMAVLALTSSSYGPRLVRNFMADRGNQTVLGVYAATFLYCLLVLRAVRVLGDPGVEDAEVFVPHLAVNGAVLLAVANVGVLVYFIHHISDSVQVATLAGGVRRDLVATVDRLYPEHPGGSPGAGSEPSELPSGGLRVFSDRTGYVQAVDLDRLVRTARRHDLLVEVRVGPGDHVLAGDLLLVVHRSQGTDRRTGRGLRRAVVVTDARTPHQDVGFAAQQLTEMAVRALSPGTNDPYTACNAVDDLSAGLAPLASRPPPSPWRRDRDGRVRVHAEGVDPARLVGTTLDQLRWYAAGAPSVMHACLTLVERVGGSTHGTDHPAGGRVRQELLRQVGLLEDAFAAAGHHGEDRARFVDHARTARDAVLGNAADA